MTGAPPVIDWDALIGWSMTAVPLLLLVAIVWYRRWRRDPAAFREQLGREAPGMRTPGAPTHRRFP